ncbi:MAG TPA: prephenate dehydratase domain-containing protein [Vicinamibacterales bacterium]|jgi:prephenate dehydratase|nr:prephenate dehydratase domain-containing protein [Vicinamibacterales bacterium]
MSTADERGTPYDACYQGRPGAYSESAARSLLGAAAALLPCDTLEDTFDALASRRATHAVVPVENTLAGTVTKTYDLLLEHDLRVVGEHVQHIDHVLIGRRGATIEGLRRTLSHPVALAQCELFFRRHPQIVPVPVFDTAGAVPLALEDVDGATAAVASRDAARLYDGAILSEHLQDHPENFTRFLLLRADRAAAEAVHPSKTIIALRLSNAPGALWAALEPFAREGINLTKIESRPVAGRPFEYAFILEFQNDRASAAVAVVLQELEQRTRWMRVVGTFPAPHA